jgi:hypothetical protein
MGHLQYTQVINEYRGTSIAVRSLDWAKVANKRSVPNKVSIVRQSKNITAFENGKQPVLICDRRWCAAANRITVLNLLRALKIALPDDLAIRKRDRQDMQVFLLVA